ncbi:hypothetical protein BIFDEN_01173 [Bifidobacterium dentium ATCC 27678]|nr:hypothetical protein BIFDEN_01173 [Bifidobacterium dentium ATCC 27678]
MNKVPQAKGVVVRSASERPAGRPRCRLQQQTPLRNISNEQHR